MARLSSYRDFEWTLLSFVGLLSIISVLEIKSATTHTKFVHFAHHQVWFLVVGVVLMFLISRVDYHKLLDITPWAYGLGIIALVAVKLVGTKVNGGRRWINLGAGIHFQPSEWVKLILILTVARYFAHLHGRGMTWTAIGKASLLVGVPLVLVKIQPDLGTSLTYLPILICGLFLGGIRVRQVLLIVATLALIGGVALKTGQHLKGYQQARINAWINPDSDPKGGSYQIKQSLIAVGDGGIMGTGANRGTQTQGDFLPTPYADFIFAAFCEEHGFVGAVGVLILYFLVLMRLIQNAQTAPDIAGTFLVMGVAAVVLFQIAVNIGMVVGLLPVTGIPLPLMSYGGSSALFIFFSLGIVMNVRMRRFVN